MRRRRLSKPLGPVPDDLAPPLEQFKLQLRAENLSLSTLENYCRAVRHLGLFLEDRGLPTKARAIGRESIRAFIAHLLDRWQPATAKAYFNGLRRFFRFLHMERVTRRNLMDGMKAPRVPLKPVPVLSDREINLLLGSCSGKDFYSRRDLAIIRTFLTTGLRRTELANLRLGADGHNESDVDLDAGLARVLGKGGWQRTVPLEPQTVVALDRYVRARHTHRASRSPWLWLGRKGRLRAHGVADVVVKRARLAGLPHIHPHQLRHTFVHLWLLEGGSGPDLMAIAGWRSGASMWRYATSTAQERAIVAHRKMSIGRRW